MQKPDAAFRFTRERGAVPTRPVLYGGSCYFSVMGLAPEIVRLDIADGRAIWRRPSNHFAPEAVRQNRVLLSTLGELRVVTEDGEDVWRLGTPLSTWQAWREAVIVAGNPLRLHSIETGAVLESIDLPTLPSGTLVSGDCYLGFSNDDRTFVAYDLVRKSVLWSQDLGPVLEEVPSHGGAELVRKAAGVGDVFIIAFRSHLIAFSVASGQFLWRQPIRAGFIPRITSDRVYSWHQEDHRSPARLICLESRSGNVMFDVDLSEHSANFRRYIEVDLPLIHSHAVVLTTRQGTVCVCSPDNGHLLWLYQHKHEVYGSAIAGDELLVITGDGLLLKFSLR